MIYDCFTFFNELDLLEIRLNVLKDVVDRFVLVESPWTHTGDPKPLFFKLNKARYEMFSSRIIHVVVDDFPPPRPKMTERNRAWINENFQRNAISRGLVGAHDDDVVLISDLDEIPNPEMVAKFAHTPGIKVFNHAYYSFYLNWRNVRQFKWLGTRMLSYSDYRTVFDGVSVFYNEFMQREVNVGTTATKIRCRFVPRRKARTRIVNKGGWHFTCLGGVEVMLAKLNACAPHHGDGRDSDDTNRERVEKLIRQGKGPGLKMNCFAVPMDDRFPRYVVDNQARFGKFVFPVTSRYRRRVACARVFRTVQGFSIAMVEWVLPRSWHAELHKWRMRVRRALRRGHQQSARDVSADG